MKILQFRRAAFIRGTFLGFTVVLSAFLAIVLASFADGEAGPLNLRASLAGGEVALFWDAPVTDAESVTGYELARYVYDHGQNLPVETGEVVTPATSTPFPGTINPATFYNDASAAEENKIYVYRVRALRGNLESLWSDYLAVRMSEQNPVPPESPPAPKNLTGTVQNGEVSLNWKAPDKGLIASYQLLRRSNKTGNSLEIYVEDTGSADTAYVDSSVEPGVRYTYRVKAINSVGVGKRSNPVSVTIPELEQDPLYVPVKPPIHMASVDWFWSMDEHANELVVDFTIHKNLNSSPPGKSGFYMMLGFSKFRGTNFYFGVQTDVLNPNPPWPPSEKGLIFSRWKTRDLSNAKVADGGWSQSAGYEGDFIGVRFPYEWGEGNYSARIGPEDGADGEDGWYGMWFTDLSTGVTTWAGSLKFPPPDDSPPSSVWVYSNMEIYGGPEIKPVDIPEWHVSLKRPLLNGVKAPRAAVRYNVLKKEVPNSDASYNETDDSMHFRAGGFTNRTTRAGRIVLS